MKLALAFIIALFAAQTWISSALAASSEDLSKTVAILAAQIQELSGKIRKLEASAVSEWTNYAPTIKSGGASGFELKGKYRRVGGDIEIWLNIQGNEIAKIGETEMWINYLPEGLNVDVPRFFHNSSRNGGTSYGSLFEVNPTRYLPAFFEIDTENFLRGRPLVGSSAIKTGEFRFNSFQSREAFISLHITVPILQWSGLGLDLRKMPNNL